MKKAEIEYTDYDVLVMSRDMLGIYRPIPYCSICNHKLTDTEITILERCNGCGSFFNKEI